MVSKNENERKMKLFQTGVNLAFGADWRRVVKLSDFPTGRAMDHDSRNSQRDFCTAVAGLDKQIAIGGKPGDLAHHRNASPTETHSQRVGLLPILTDLTPDGGRTDTTFVAAATQ